MAQTKAGDIDQTIKDLKRNIKMEAEDIVKANQKELGKDHPKIGTTENIDLKAKVDKVSKKFPEIMNLYDSLGWAESFNPALKEAEKSFGEILSQKSKSLAQVKTDVKNKIATQKESPVLTQEKWVDEMSWVLHADES